MQTQAEVEHFLKYAIDEYGRGMWEAGEYPTLQGSINASEREIMSYFGNPREHKAHYPFFIYSKTAGCNVGLLVVSSLERWGKVVAFIDYIGVYEPHRRKGYATQGMLLMEEFVQTKGLTSVDLNVLIHRTYAQAFYRKLGYYEKQRWIGGYARHITRVDMRKDLQPPAKKA